MSAVISLDARRERILRDALDKLAEIEERLRELEGEFARLAPLAAALIERGEIDD